MSQHDTAAIRRLAKRLDGAAASLSTTGRNAVRQIESINAEMRGDTTIAINSTVEKLGSEIQSIRNGLTKCAETLYRYARDLDAADEKAKNLIDSK